MIIFNVALGVTEEFVRLGITEFGFSRVIIGAVELPAKSVCGTGESSIVNETIKRILIFLRNVKQTIFTFLEVFLREKLFPLLFSVCLILFFWLMFSRECFCARKIFS